MPTVLRVGPYRFFFYAGDQDEPPHVHVERDDAEAKFWLDPVRLQRSHGFGASEIRLDRPTFQRVFVAIQSESASQDITELDGSEIHRIGIFDTLRPTRAVTSTDWWKDRLALWG